MLTLNYLRLWISKSICLFLTQCVSVKVNSVSMWRRTPAKSLSRNILNYLYSFLRFYYCFDSFLFSFYHIVKFKHYTVILFNFLFFILQLLFFSSPSCQVRNVSFKYFFFFLEMWITNLVMTPFKKIILKQFNRYLLLSRFVDWGEGARKQRFILHMESECIGESKFTSFVCPFRSLCMISK